MEILTIILICAHLTLNLPSLIVAQQSTKTPTTTEAASTTASTTVATASTTASSTTAKLCQHRLTELHGYIYSDNISPSSLCTWTIEIPYGRVELYFIYVYINSINNYGSICNSDYVTIYDGYLWNSVILGKICEYTSQVFSSSSNALTLQFVNPNHGFFALYYYSSSLSTTAFPTTRETTTTASTTTKTTTPGKLEDILCCIIPNMSQCYLDDSKKRDCKFVPISGGTLGNQNNIFFFNYKLPEKKE